MMEHKRNWIQPLTLALCAVLLGVNLWQGKQLSELEENIRYTETVLSDEIGSVGRQVSGLSSRLEEGEKLVRDWELTPAGMDRKSGLLTEISLTLKEWRADTEVRLTARQGIGTHIVTLGNDGAGRFSGSLPVSLEGEEPLFLEVQIVSDGTSRREELGSWDDVSMLLPVHFDGDSYYAPTYQNGVFSMDEYIVDLADKNNRSVAVREPVFYIKLNGETVRTVEALSQQEAWKAAGWSEQVIQNMGLSLESEGYALKDVEVQCRPGDIVALFFSCRDTYGLGYTFPLRVWEIDPKQMRDSHIDTSTCDSAFHPILSWD